MGMGKVAQPFCQDGDYFIPITNDAYIGDYCAIRPKRVDAVWGPWGEIVTPVDNETHFKQVEGRNLRRPAAHGGKTEGSNERLVTFIKWVKEKKTWSDAVDNCLLIGGKLFANLDGSTTQLDFFFQHLDMKSHWLGVYTTNHEVWLDTEGNEVDNSVLHWDEDQTFNTWHVSSIMFPIFEEKENFT